MKMEVSERLSVRLIGRALSNEPAALEKLSDAISKNYITHAIYTFRLAN